MIFDKFLITEKISIMDLHKKLVLHSKHVRPDRTNIISTFQYKNLQRKKVFVGQCFFNITMFLVLISSFHKIFHLWSRFSCIFSKHFIVLTARDVARNGKTEKYYE